MATERRKRGSRAEGRQPKHAARALARHLAAGTLDGRTWVGRTLAALRAELAADAGGVAHLTARERVLLDRIAAATLICSTIEAHVFRSDRLVDGAGELLPILRKGYVTHVQSLSRMLQALGLRPERGDALLSTCPACRQSFTPSAYVHHACAEPPPAAPAAPDHAEAHREPADAAASPAARDSRCRDAEDA